MNKAELADSLAQKKMLAKAKPPQSALNLMASVRKEGGSLAEKLRHTLADEVADKIMGRNGGVRVKRA